MPSGSAFRLHLHRAATGEFLAGRNRRPQKDRVYLPLDVLSKHGYTVDELFALSSTTLSSDDARAVEVARRSVPKGLPLIKIVDRRLALDLELFSRGGMKESRARFGPELQRSQPPSAYLESGTRRNSASMPTATAPVLAISHARAVVSLLPRDRAQACQELLLFVSAAG